MRLMIVEEACEFSHGLIASGERISCFRLPQWEIVMHIINLALINATIFNLELNIIQTHQTNTKKIDFPKLNIKAITTRAWREPRGMRRARRHNGT